MVADNCGVVINRDSAGRALGDVNEGALWDMIDEGFREEDHLDNDSFLSGFVSEVSETWAELEDKI